MLRRLIGRLPLLAINVIGISIIVFLLGRWLPGAVPAARGDQTEALAIDSNYQQWYARRYGLDQPLHQQYLRWWRSMFVIDRQVLLWTEEHPARPVYLSPRDGQHVVHIVPGEDGQWLRFIPDAAIRGDEALETEHERVQHALHHADRAALGHLVGPAAPLHRFLPGRIGSAVDRPADAAPDRAAQSVQQIRCTLGWSRLTNTTVATELKRRLPVTATISGVSVLLTYLIAVPIGVASAARRGDWLDRTVHAVTIMLWSVPMVVMGTILLGVLAIELEWLPLGGTDSPHNRSLTVTGALLDHGRHLALPIVVLTLPGVAYVARQVRSAVLEQIDADFMVTARAKGLSRGQAIRRHALRPAMVVVATMLATVLPFVIGGSVIVESLFAIEGMGRFVYRAVLSRDYDVVQSFTLLAAAANMFGIAVADVACALIDPRVAAAESEVRA